MGPIYPNLSNDSMLLSLAWSLFQFLGMSDLLLLLTLPFRSFCGKNSVRES